MIAIEQAAFLEILTFIAGAIFFVGIGSFLSFGLRSYRSGSSKEKSCTYESGEESIGSPWRKFNTRFHDIAIVFMFFEIETVLLFPWAVVWADPLLNKATGGLWAQYAAMSAFFFIVLLSIGLAHVWGQGHLIGIQPPPSSSVLVAKVPRSVYDRFNDRHAAKNNEDGARRTIE